MNRLTTTVTVTLKADITFSDAHHNVVSFGWVGGGCAFEVTSANRLSEVLEVLTTVQYPAERVHEVRITQTLQVPQ